MVQPTIQKTTKETEWLATQGTTTRKTPKEEQQITEPVLLQFLKLELHVDQILRAIVHQADPAHRTMAEQLLRMVHLPKTKVLEQG